MNQDRVPEIPAQPPSPSAVQQAYRSGYLDGHLAGWRDALAAQAAQTASGVQITQAAPAQPLVTSPVAAPPVNGPPVPQLQLPPPHALQQPLQQPVQGPTQSQTFPARPAMAGPRQISCRRPCSAKPAPWHRRSWRSVRHMFPLTRPPWPPGRAGGKPRTSTSPCTLPAC